MRVLTLVLSALMALAAAACGDGETPDLDRAARSTSTTTAATDAPNATDAPDAPGTAADPATASTTAMAARPAPPAGPDATGAPAPGPSPAPPPPPPPAPAIVLSVFWDGAYDLVTMSDAGTVRANLTNHQPRSDQVAVRPSWSPTRAQLVFEVQRGSGSQLMIAGADGGGVRAVGPTGGRAGWAAWSPDGRTIAFSYDGRLHTMAPDGTGLRRLVDPPPDEWPSTDTMPTWSPDSRTLLFVREYAEPRKPLGDDPGGPEDERFIGSYLYRVAADGTGVGRLTAGAHAFDIDPDWSPDGTTIVFTGATGDPDAAQEVTVMRPDGSGRRPLFPPSSPGRGCTHPHWSPHGARLGLLCYVTKGNFVDTELFISAADGSGLRRITERPKGDMVRDLDW